MADAFKSDYFNMPVHVSVDVKLPALCLQTFCMKRVLRVLKDGAHRAGGERVLAFGGSH